MTTARWPRILGKTGVGFPILFELVNSGERYYINVETAQVSREWLQTLVNQFVVGKQIEISADVYKTLTGMFGK